MFLATNGATVDALDISSTAIERATEYLKKNHGDVENRVTFKEGVRHFLLLLLFCS